MYNKNNIFYKILKSEIPCNKIFENEVCLAFYDVNPQCKIHALVITKGLYQNFGDFVINANEKEIKAFMESVKKVVDILGITDSGYRILTNTGRDAGQEVKHFHVHILGGEKI